MKQSIAGFSQGIEKILDTPFPEGTGRIRDLINKCAKEFLSNKQYITEGKVPPEPVRLAIRHVCSRSGHLAKIAETAEKQLSEINPLNLLKERELESFLEKVYKSNSNMRQESKEKISRFLIAIEDLNDKLRQWPKSERLEKFEKEFKKILELKAKIGRKGCDNILRDCGFLKCIPIDVHEQRFLIRTGIFHKYAINGADPTDYDHLANSMSNFSKCELRKIDVNGIRLSEAPGLVDLIIWYFSQEKSKKELSLGICAKQPQCKNCPLNNLCHFAKCNVYIDEIQKRKRKNTKKVIHSSIKDFSRI